MLDDENEVEDTLNDSISEAVGADLEAYAADMGDTGDIGSATCSEGSVLEIKMSSKYEGNNKSYSNLNSRILSKLSKNDRAMGDLESRCGEKAGGRLKRCRPDDRDWFEKRNKGSISDVIAHDDSGNDAAGV